MVLRSGGTYISGTITNGPAVVGIGFAFAAVAVLVVGGASAYGLWAGRRWAVALALAGEAGWALWVLICGIGSTYPLPALAVFMLPALVVAGLLVGNTLGRPSRD